MPIYEYQCAACGHHLEVLQKMNEVALVDCPICGKATLTKLISATSFQLKGTGWYATDFKNKTPTETKKEGSTTDSKIETAGKPETATPNATTTTTDKTSN
jgi:putative FmdB family regulatory protein